jgi:hypothetical protein
MDESQALLALSSGVRIRPPCAHSRANAMAAAARRNSSWRCRNGSLQRSSHRASMAPNAVCSTAQPRDSDVTNNAENSQNAGVSTSASGIGASATLQATNHFTCACATVACGIAPAMRQPSIVVARISRTRRDPICRVSRIGTSCAVACSTLIEPPDRVRQAAPPSIGRQRLGAPTQARYRTSNERVQADASAVTIACISASHPACAGTQI